MKGEMENQTLVLRTLERTELRLGEREESRRL